MTRDIRQDLRQYDRAFCEREEGKDRTYYAPVVEYVFQVYGHEYRSRQIKLGIEMTGSQIFAEAIAAKYP